MKALKKGAAALKNIDFAKIAAETVGEAGTLFVLGQAPKVPIIANMKPTIRGVIYKIVGRVLIPMAAGKKSSAILDGVGDTLSVAGTSLVLNAATKGKTPAIGGYESNPISGYQFDEPIEGVEEDEAIEGFDEDEE